jgi:hypothetical protein
VAAEEYDEAKRLKLAIERLKVRAAAHGAAAGMAGGDHGPYGAAVCWLEPSP